MDRADFDPYEVLGLDRSATPEQIRAAYRELVGRYHPDKHQGNPLAELAQQKMRDVNRAFDMLSSRHGTAATSYTAGHRTTAAHGQAGTRRPNGAQPQTVTPSGPIAPTGRSLVGWLFYGLGLVVLVRFGLLFVRELAALLRVLAALVFRLGALGPVVAFFVLFALAWATRAWLRRRGRG